MNRFAAFMSLLVAFGSVELARAETPEEAGAVVARKESAAHDGYKTETADLEMVLVDAHGRTTTRKMAYAATEFEGDGDRSRIEISWPADVQGTRLLTWSHKSGTDDQWLFLPAVGAVKRISGGAKSGAFMGSEFAFEDLSSPEVEKYTYKFLEETSLEGRKVWKYERKPVDSASGYSRHVAYTDQEYLQPLRIEFYDRKGDLLKTMDFEGYTRHDKWWRWTRIEVTNAQTKKSSSLSASKRILGTSLPANHFASEALED